MARHVYAQAPDGTILKRQTHHNYRFAVLARHANGWGAARFSGSRQLAERGRREVERWGYRPQDVVIVPVTDTPPE